MTNASVIYLKVTKSEMLSLQKKIAFSYVM